MDKLILLFVIAMIYFSAQLGWAWYRKKRLITTWNESQELLKTGHKEDALPLLRRCVRMEPAWPMAHVILGMTLANLGELDEGEKEIRMAAELTPREVLGFKNLCFFYALFRPEKHEEALEVLKKVKDLDPEGFENFLEEPRLRLLRNLYHADR